MSECIIWEICPCCGRPAAVGWSPTGTGDTAIGNDPIEFDCVAGCQLSAAQLRAVFLRHRGTHTIAAT